MDVPRTASDRGSEELYAAVVVTRGEAFEVIERVGVAGPARFPYIPGLLSFREAPAFIRGRFRERRAVSAPVMTPPFGQSKL